MKNSTICLILVVLLIGTCKGASVKCKKDSTLTSMTVVSSYAEPSGKWYNHFIDSVVVGSTAQKEMTAMDCTEQTVAAANVIGVTYGSAVVGTKRWEIVNVGNPAKFYVKQTDASTGNFVSSLLLSNVTCQSPKAVTKIGDDLIVDCASSYVVHDIVGQITDEYFYKSYTNSQVSPILTSNVVNGDGDAFFFGHQTQQFNGSAPTSTQNAFVAKFSVPHQTLLAFEGYTAPTANDKSTFVDAIYRQATKTFITLIQEYNQDTAKHRLVVYDLNLNVQKSMGLDTTMKFLSSPIPTGLVMPMPTSGDFAVVYQTGSHQQYDLNSAIWDYNTNTAKYESLSLGPYALTRSLVAHPSMPYVYTMYQDGAGVHRTIVAMNGTTPTDPTNPDSSSNSTSNNNVSSAAEGVNKPIDLVCLVFLAVLSVWLSTQ